MIEKLRAKYGQSRPVPVPAAPETTQDAVEEVLLVSSPGFGILDSGCGRSIIGRQTLQAFEKLWARHGLEPPSPVREVNSFRYGNGQTEISEEVVYLPVILAGRRGMISAAVVRGQAPLLMSRHALQTLQACIDFGKGQMTLFPDKATIDLQTNEAGQLMIPLYDENYLHHETHDPSAPAMTEVDAVIQDPGDESPNETSEVVMSHEPNTPKHDTVVTLPTESTSPSCDEHTHVWLRDDWGIQQAPIHTPNGPKWSQVFRRIVRNGETGKIIFEDNIDSSTNRRHLQYTIPTDVKHVITEFHYRGTEIAAVEVQHSFSSHQVRQVEHQVKHAKSPNPKKKQRLMVVEVFSPPRFAPECESVGFRARSYDLVTGHDLSLLTTQREVEQSIRDDPPELLIICPPCTHESGWVYLNMAKGNSAEYLQKLRQSREFIKFGATLFKLQVSLGGRALFEHPSGAKTWKYPEMAKLCRQYHLITCHMCCYGLKIPSSDRYIRKSTKLLVSHEDMKILAKMCPGDHRHDVVAGSHPEVGPISKYVAKYTPQFVQAVLDTVPEFHQHTTDVLEVIEDHFSNDDTWKEVLAVGQKADASEADLKQTLLKVHKNLGHPGNHDLVRILKHGQATDKAIALARDLTCPVCQSHAQPKAALPAQTQRVSEFNWQIGIDCKVLPGWKPNQKVKALNIVDTASGFQKIIPFHEVETSRLLWTLLQEHWFSWAGVPHEIVLDPAATNLGEPLVVPLECQGVHIRPIAADAHYQLGKTESHGKWFERILTKIIDEHTPKNKEEWTECVYHGHIKNAMIQNHGVTPHQFVFGRNPRIPSDLMDEPSNVVAKTASLTEEGLARAQAIKTSARQAVIALQDNRSLRLAMSARPRTVTEFAPGALVSYWRSQKWLQGVLHNQGRWYGTATVLGKVGRNYVLAHRKQILRAAPEQVRAATNEEISLLTTPNAELLGIKDLIEGGAFKSQQYIDLVSQSYPTSGQQVGVPPSVAEAPKTEPETVPNVSDTSTIPQAPIDQSPPPLTTTIAQTDQTNVVDVAPAPGQDVDESMRDSVSSPPEPVTPGRSRSVRSNS